LQFKADINPSDVVLRRVEDTDLGGSFGALEVSIAGTTDSITFNAFFYDDSPQNSFNTVQQIRFADGTTWDLSEISRRAFVGTSGDDYIVGLRGADTLMGGAGNDTLLGGQGADTYLFSIGDGEDVIDDSDVAGSGSMDRIRFGAGIEQEDLSFTQSESHLEIGIQGTTDNVTVRNWFVDSEHRVEELVFADDSVLSDSQVQNLISAMAGFSAHSATSADAGGRVGHGTVIDFAVSAL